MIQHGAVEMKALSAANQQVVDTIEEQFIADLEVAFGQLASSAGSLYGGGAILTSAAVNLVAATAVAHTQPYFKAAFTSAQSEAARQSADLVSSLTGEEVSSLTSALVQAGVTFAHSERLTSLLPGLTEQTAQAIGDAVKRGIESGWGPYQSRREVERLVAGSGMYPNVAEDKGDAAAVRRRSETIARTETAWARNTATTAYLSASRDVEMLYVVDGPDCGWTYHDDADLANGKHVTFAEAQRYPVSHPNCRRSFGPVFRSNTPAEGSDA